MPEAEDFLEGYGFSVGQLNLGPWTLTQRQAEHHSIVQWNEYSYPILLQFEAPGTKPSTQQLLADLVKFIAPIRIIYTPSGRPYKCRIQTVPQIAYQTTENVDNEPVTGVVISCEGYAKRIGRSEADEIQSGRRGW